MSTDFRIHSICLVKNEADVLEACLKAASRWSDRIIIYDNGSDDGTWELAQRLASDRVIPWKQDAKGFQESLRAEVFNEFRAQAKPGDWWCRLDADEFYAEDPRTFLSKVPWPYHVVWGIAAQFYLTEKDLEPSPLASIEERLESLSYYAINDSEARFFRHRQGLCWPLHAAWPAQMGPAFKKRILYKHYKYRSPEQIERRLGTRRKAIADGFPGWWSQADAKTWQERISNSRDLKKFDGRTFEFDEAKLPNHLEPAIKRLLKVALHGIKLLP
jgi:glycosyltransferase involved in cell wall biosynthesis